MARRRRGGVSSMVSMWAMEKGIQAGAAAGRGAVRGVSSINQKIKAYFVTALWIVGGFIAYFLFPPALFWVYIMVMVGIFIASFFIPSFRSFAIFRADTHRVNEVAFREQLLANYFSNLDAYGYGPMNGWNNAGFSEYGIEGGFGDGELRAITLRGGTSVSGDIVVSNSTFVPNGNLESELAVLSTAPFMNSVGKEWAKYIDEGVYGLEFLNDDEVEESTLKANKMLREVKMVNPKTKQLEYIIDPNDRFLREGVQLWHMGNEFILSLPDFGLMRFEDKRKANSSSFDEFTPVMMDPLTLFNALKSAGVITRGRVEGEEIYWDAVIDKKELAANNFLKHTGLIKPEDFIDAKVEQYPDKIVLTLNELIPGKNSTQIVKTLRDYESELGAFASKSKVIPGGVEITYLTNAAQEVIDGNKFLQDKGVIRPEEFYDFVSMESKPERTVITVDGTMGAINNNLILSKLDKFKSEFGAIKLTKVDLPGGGAKFNFIVDSILDDSSKSLRNAPGNLNIEKMEVDCAINEEGEIETLKFDGTPGLLISGIPGSGKTAGATSFLLPLALSPHVDFNVIDGKGGADWEAYGPASDVFISGSDGNMDEINDFLLEAVRDMDERVKTNKQLLGNSNFWNVPAAERLRKGRKYKIIIIDECQELFTPIAGASKEEKETQKQIISSCTKLIKKGRSAGITVVFLTQKTTADSIPTAIRDNCALRISFRQMTPTAEMVAIGFDLGGIPGAARPINIPPSRKGGAVIMTESGDLREVRFFYIPENIQEGLLNNAKK